MESNFDDQWDELEEDIIKECIIIENQTLSQISIDRDNVGISSSKSNKTRVNAILEFPSEKVKICDVKNSNKFKFPTISAFNETSFSSKELQKISNFKKVLPIQTSLNNKVYNSIPIKGNLNNGNNVANNLKVKNKFGISSCSRSNQLPVLQFHNDKVAENSVENQLEIFQQEQEKLREENFIRQGEVYNLRCELKRKETALETERVDHCLAVEAAEKRGKEKNANSLKESELKVKTLQVEIEKLYGSIAFKNREVEELLSRCNQLEQINHNALTSSGIKKPPDISQSSKRFKREPINYSPSKFPSNFSDRFDFDDKKRVKKDAQVQTVESHVIVRPVISISSTKGNMTSVKKALILASSRKPISNPDQFSKDQLIMERRLHSLSNNWGLSTLEETKTVLTSSIMNNNYIMKSVCLQLENILRQCQTSSPGDKRKTGENIKIEELYEESVSPLFNMLSITTTKNEIIISDSIETLVKHISFISQQLQISDSCLFSGLEALLNLGKDCETLPTSLSVTIIQSFTSCLERLNLFKGGTVLLIRAVLCFIKLNTFKNKICIAKQDNNSICLLSRISNLFSSEAFFYNEEHTRIFVAFVSILLQPPIDWLTSKCSCSVNLLHALVKQLYSLTVPTATSKESTWHIVLLGIKVLHKWQLIDTNWWEAIAPLPTYTILMGAVVRKCRILKARGDLDQYIWELLYDLHETDEA